MKDFFNKLKMFFKQFSKLIKDNPYMIFLIFLFFVFYFVPFKWAYSNTTNFFTYNGNSVSLKVNGWTPLTVFGMLGLPDFYSQWNWNIFAGSSIFTRHYSYHKLYKESIKGVEK